jgi:hypothetical protein
LYFFYFCSQRIVTLRHTFAVPKDTSPSSLPFFPQFLVYSPVLHRTACGAVVALVDTSSWVDLHVRHDGFFLGSGSGMEGSQVLMESRRVSVSFSVGVSESEPESTSESSSESRSVSSSVLVSVSASSSETETFMNLVGSMIPAALSDWIWGRVRRSRLLM